MFTGGGGGRGGPENKRPRSESRLDQCEPACKRLTCTRLRDGKRFIAFLKAHCPRLARTTIHQSTLKHRPRSVGHSLGPGLANRQYTVLGTLPAGTAAAGEANYEGIALNLAHAAELASLVGPRGAFSGFSGPRALWLDSRRTHGIKEYKRG